MFIGFKGGRGESTAIGVLLTMITQPMLIVGGPAVLAIIIKRHVILASALLFIPLPFVCWWLGVPGALVAYSIGLLGYNSLPRSKEEVIKTGRVLEHIAIGL
ncbi:glycerol-3-phosphate acyltransferase [Chloroflexota bacterium]